MDPNTVCAQIYSSQRHFQETHDDFPDDFSLSSFADADCV